MTRYAISSSHGSTVHINICLQFQQLLYVGYLENMKNMILQGLELLQQRKFEALTHMFSFLSLVPENFLFFVKYSILMILRKDLSLDFGSLDACLNSLNFNSYL